MTRGGVRTECLWYNFPSDLPRHDTRYVGGDYRERERINRRKARWKARLVCLSPEERQAVWEALQSVMDLATPKPPVPPAATPGVMV